MEVITVNKNKAAMSSKRGETLEKGVGSSETWLTNRFKPAPEAEGTHLMEEDFHAVLQGLNKTSRGATVN